MPRVFSSESTIEEIVESLIPRSLADGQQEDIGPRHFQEGDNSLEVPGDAIELAELSRDLTTLLLDLQALEERLGTTRIRSVYRRGRGSRSFEGEPGRSRRERLEVGLERIRQRRLNRFVRINGYYRCEPQIFRWIEPWI